MERNKGKLNITGSFSLFDLRRWLLLVLVISGLWEPNFPMAMAAEKATPLETIRILAGNYRELTRFVGVALKDDKTREMLKQYFFGPGDIGGNDISDRMELLFSFSPHTGAIDPSRNTAHYQSRTLASPLILDLDGRGIGILELSTGYSKQILFDHGGDGMRTGTAWVKADDGLLALDRNGNGTIDSGRELFGNHTLLSDGRTAADGYAALAELDSNGDGFIDAQDALFGQLRVWRDLDLDGISDAGELKSLAETGITRISLGKTAVTTTFADGTRLDGWGEFIIDGQTRHYTDAWFAENGFYREFTDTIPLTDAARALPDMHGSGMVRNLREAASLDARLIADVQGMTREMSRAQMMIALDGLIAHWADTSTMKTSFRMAEDRGYTLVYLPAGMSASNYLDGTSSGALEQKRQHIAQRIGILERFNSKTFVDVESDRIVTGGGATIMASGAYVFHKIPDAQLLPLERSYILLKESIYDGLVLQTRLKPYLDEILPVFGKVGTRLDYSALEARFDTLYASDPIRAFTDALDLHLHSKLSDWNVIRKLVGWNATRKLVGWLGKIEANGQLDALKAELGTKFVSIIQFGGNGNDSLSGDDNDNIIHAGAGNDALHGGAGNDALIGGPGNDTLKGDAGDDTYIFSAGDGQDTIYDDGGTDTLRLGSYTPGDLGLQRSGNDLFIILGGDDRITLQSCFSGSVYQVERIEFADGSVHMLADLLAASSF